MDMKKDIQEVIEQFTYGNLSIEQASSEILGLFNVVVPKGTLTMCHARTGKECIKPTSCQAFGCNKQM